MSGTRRRLLISPAARNQTMFCADAQIRQGIVHASRSNIYVARFRPNLSVMIPLRSAKTIWPAARRS